MSNFNHIRNSVYAKHLPKMQMGGALDSSRPPILGNEQEGQRRVWRSTEGMIMYEFRNGQWEKAFPKSTNASQPVTLAQSTAVGHTATPSDVQIQPTTAQATPQPSVEGDLSSTGQGQTGLFGNLTGKLSGGKGMLSSDKLEKVGNVFGKIGNVLNYTEQLATDLQTARTQDDNKTWKDELKESASTFLTGNIAGAIGNLVTKGLDTAEEALMGDKNFNQFSSVMDNATRAASNRLRRLGITGTVIGAVLDAANFADKAAGKTVQGFEVGDVGAGFSGVETDRESASFRGSQTASMKKALAQRQEAVNMALTANTINDFEQFQATARMNSVDEVMNANRFALAGGLDTSLIVN